MKIFKNLKVGDVVLCRFPTEERPGLPGPKVRPCVVVSVRRKTMFSRGTVEVAYGTSVFKQKPGKAIHITSIQDLDSAGLKKPSQFLMGKRARITMRGDFMQSHIGHLPERWLPIIKMHLIDEDVSGRFEARRFGRKEKQQPWTMSSDLHKETLHA